jgi:DNA-binding transcriptional LysR family regulator
LAERCFRLIALESQQERLGSKASVSDFTQNRTLSPLWHIASLRCDAMTRQLSRQGGLPRSFSPTQAGERLLRSIGPRLDEIDVELASLNDLRERPAGTVRIKSGEHPAQTILWPALKKLLPNYPDVNVEVIVDYGLTDIVSERYDAGVRLGEQVAKDMIAVPIGPDMRMAFVGAPSYLARRPAPKMPQDLIRHNCINIRLPTHGGVHDLGVRKTRT